jgi:hypothetical protein
MAALRVVSNNSIGCCSRGNPVLYLRAGMIWVKAEPETRDNQKFLIVDIPNQTLDGFQNVSLNHVLTNSKRIRDRHDDGRICASVEHRPRPWRAA